MSDMKEEVSGIVVELRSIAEDCSVPVISGTVLSMDPDMSAEEAKIINDGLNKGTIGIAINLKPLESVLTDIDVVLDADEGYNGYSRGCISNWIDTISKPSAHNCQLFMIDVPDIHSATGGKQPVFAGMLARITNPTVHHLTTGERIVIDDFDGDRMETVDIEFSTDKLPFYDNQKFRYNRKSGRMEATGNKIYGRGNNKNKRRKGRKR